MWAIMIEDEVFMVVKTRQAARMIVKEIGGIIKRCTVLFPKDPDTYWKKKNAAR